MPVYKLDKLIEETRRLAVEYRESTGTSLPITAELAKHDAIRILGLQEADKSEAAVDAYWPQGRSGEPARGEGSDTAHSNEDTAQGAKKVQIKGRAIFDTEKKAPRIGQLNIDGAWDSVLLVLMNENYQSTHIYELTRARLLQELEDPRSLKKNARGAMSVSKFRAIANLVWHNDAL